MELTVNMMIKARKMVFLQLWMQYLWMQHLWSPQFGECKMPAVSENSEMPVVLSHSLENAEHMAKTYGENSDSEEDKNSEEDKKSEQTSNQSPQSRQLRQKKQRLTDENNRPQGVFPNWVQQAQKFHEWMQRRPQEKHYSSQKDSQDFEDLRKDSQDSSSQKDNEILHKSRLSAFCDVIRSMLKDLSWSDGFGKALKSLFVYFKDYSFHLTEIKNPDNIRFLDYVRILPFFESQSNNTDSDRNTSVVMKRNYSAVAMKHQKGIFIGHPRLAFPQFFAEKTEHSDNQKEHSDNQKTSERVTERVTDDDNKDDDNKKEREYTYHYYEVSNIPCVYIVPVFRDHSTSKKMELSVMKEDIELSPQRGFHNGLKEDIEKHPQRGSHNGKEKERNGKENSSTNQRGPYNGTEEKKEEKKEEIRYMKTHHDLKKQIQTVNITPNSDPNHQTHTLTLGIYLFGDDESINSDDTDVSHSKKSGTAGNEKKTGSDEKRLSLQKKNIFKIAYALTRTSDSVTFEGDIQLAPNNFGKTAEAEIELKES